MYLRFQHENHRSLPVSNEYVLDGLYPNTLYHVWLAAKSKRGEGAATPPIATRTEQYGNFSFENRGSAVTKKENRIICRELKKVHPHNPPPLEKVCFKKTIGKRKIKVRFMQKKGKSIFVESTTTH